MTREEYKQERDAMLFAKYFTAIGIVIALFCYAAQFFHWWRY